MLHYHTEVNSSSEPAKTTVGPKAHDGEDVPTNEHPNTVHHSQSQNVTNALNMLIFGDSVMVASK